MRGARGLGRGESQTGRAPFDRGVAPVRSQEPYRSAPRVFGIIDHGSGPRGQKAIRRLQTWWPTSVPVPTPVHARGWNQIEIYFSIVQRKGLTPNHFTSLAELEDRLRRFQEHDPPRAAPFQWTFTRRDLATLLTKLDDPRCAYAA